VPITERPDLRLDLTNLRSLCRRHHQLKTLRDRQRPDLPRGEVKSCHLTVPYHAVPGARVAAKLETGGEPDS
jgi:hypothetical protein